MKFYISDLHIGHKRCLDKDFDNRFSLHNKTDKIQAVKERIKRRLMCKEGRICILSV